MASVVQFNPKIKPFYSEYTTLPPIQVKSIRHLNSVEHTQIHAHTGRITSITVFINVPRNVGEITLNANDGHLKIVQNCVNASTITITVIVCPLSSWHVAFSYYFRAIFGQCRYIQHRQLPRESVYLGKHVLIQSSHLEISVENSMKITFPEK